MLYYAAPIFLPLFGAVIAGLFGRVIGARAARLVSCGAMGAAALMAVVVFNEVALQGEVGTVVLFDWFSSGDLDVDWLLRFDELTAAMVFVVCVVSFLIHVYSIGYMAHDPHVPRFFAYLSLFTFFMLALVSADNFLQMFFGWEGVGLVSYLLIGFWYKRPAANAAAIKAFIVNRVGDFGFALGILAIFLMFDTVSFDAVFAGAPAMVDAELTFLGHSFDFLEVACILLFVGAMGKSAQFLLHTWLPDAMEGPTPVSALIHAATMVTAGVFMVVRLSPIFEYAPIALSVVTFFGATTAIFAADRRDHPERHQARDRLFDLQPARLHVLRLRRLGLRRRHLPPDHPRVLQGAALPRRGRGDPRHVGRAGHAQDGRHLAHDPGDLRADVDRQSRARRHLPLLRLLLEGRDPRVRLRRPYRGSAPTPSGSASWRRSSPRSIRGGCSSSPSTAGRAPTRR